VRITKVGAPIATADWNDAQFRNDDGGPDSSRDFFRCLDAQSDVSFRVSNDDNGLESGSLASASLFLNRLDLQTTHKSASSLIAARLSIQGRVLYRMSSTHLHDLILELG
jgi:hypothetical protein